MQHRCTQTQAFRPMAVPFPWTKAGRQTCVLRRHPSKHVWRAQSLIELLSCQELGGSKRPSRIFGGLCQNIHESAPQSPGFLVPYLSS